jgi:hypothetical protein
MVGCDNIGNTHLQQQEVSREVAKYGKMLSGPGFFLEQEAGLNPNLEEKPALGPVVFVDFEAWAGDFDHRERLDLTLWLDSSLELCS